MGHIGGGEVVGVHLLFQGLYGHVDEETGMSGPGAAPEHVCRLVVVPCCCFCNNARRFGGICQVGADVMKALG